MTTCLFCKSDRHPWWDCTKKPEGWKPNAPQTRSAAKPESGLQDVQAVESERRADRVSDRREVERSQTAGQRLIRSAEQAREIVRKMGRPQMEGASQGKSKRAVEMRQYMRERRAKLKGK